MRQKRERIFEFVSNDQDLPKTVREYRAKFRGISQRLDQHPEILDRVHKDLKALSEGDRHGRPGDFTSETLLRALIVMMAQGDSYRETVVRIGESEFLQDFVRTRKKAVMDHTFLNRAFKAIRPATWRLVNQSLVKVAVNEEQTDPSVIRTDTTVVETNIHYPTDSSLLWDTWRVASRILARARTIDSSICPHRFHDRRIKRLHLFITRYSNSTSKSRKREVKRQFRTLIERVTWIVGIAGASCDRAAQNSCLSIQGLGLELAEYLPAMQTVVQQARRSQIDGETVPATQRVFSIFEPHTELIKRGRRGKPVEFGHTVLLCQTKEKLISDYEVFEHRSPDCNLTELVIDRHEKLFGEAPEVLAGDKGFCPDAETYQRLEERVETLAIPRRMRDYADAMMTAWQAFRAGIEGTISGLKRAFRLVRCYFRSFKSYEASIGLGVFCHNLIVLAKLDTT